MSEVFKNVAVERLKNGPLLLFLMKTKLAQGAEAVIYSDGTTVEKDRFEKKYRHPELDARLRKTRTRREGKILTKLADAGVHAPDLILTDDKSMKVSMTHVPGEMVKDAVDSLESSGDSEEVVSLMNEIGLLIGVLHNNGIVHHDLTTSNMILHSEKKKVYLIDFGLSFFSDKIEDYAVDLHLLRHALESRHHLIWEKCFFAVSDGYRSSMLKAEDVLKRLETVEKRGRYKTRH